MDDICKICNVRLSNWDVYFDKTIYINGKLFHRECVERAKPSEVVKAVE